ncbi:MAG: ATP-binding protein [Planctomycetota bacterium]|jgi:serine/threonine-protein kinase RsbW
MKFGTPIKRSLVVKSTTSAALQVCKDILSELKRSDFSEDNVFAIHLALEEAFTNSIRHGNKMDPEKEIGISYSLGSDKFEATVTDEGGGFEPKEVPDPRCGDNIYKIDGRGLFLICSYMDEVTFNKFGNSVHMVKYRKEALSPKTVKDK